MVEDVSETDVCKLFESNYLLICSNFFSIPRGLRCSDSRFEWSPLHYAVANDDLKTVNALLKEENIDVNCQNDRGPTPLIVGIVLQCSLPVNISLLNAGCDVNMMDQCKRIPLQESLLNGNNNIAHELIKRNADLNVQDKCSLFYAIESNNIEALCMLLYYGAVVSVRYLQKFTPLTYAIRRRNGILLNYCDDINYTNKNGYAPLHLIARNESDLAMQIIDAGADVNCITHDGYSVLEFALQSGEHDLFKKIWSKLDYQSLLQIQRPLLLSYLKSVFSTTGEWVECFPLMLESPIAFDLVQHCNKYISQLYYKAGFFAELLYVPDYKRINLDVRMTIISICLSLGVDVTIADINFAFWLFGFNEELEALIYAADSCIIDAHHISHPLLSLILAVDDFNLESVITLYKYKIIERGISQIVLVKNIIYSLEFFSLPYCKKLELIHFCSLRMSSDHEIIQRIKAVPEFPSLLELSRNQAHSFIRQKCSTTKPYHFHDAVKNLRLPRIVTDVLRFKTPIYGPST